MSKFSSTHISESFYAGLLAISSSCSPYWYLEWPWPGCRAMHLTLLSFTRFSRVHSSSLSRSLCMASLPSRESVAPLSMVSPTNLVRVHSIPPCYWWKYFLKICIAAIPANALKALGWIPLGAMDFCMFRFLRWSWTWSFLTVREGLHCPSVCLNFTNLGDGKERQTVKTEVKNLLGASVFSLPVVTKSPVCFYWGAFYLVLLFWSVYLQKPSLFFTSLATFSYRSTLAFLIPSLHTWTALSILPRMCPCFHCLCIYSLHFCLTRRSLLSHIDFLLS